MKTIKCGKCGKVSPKGSAHNKRSCGKKPRDSQLRVQNTQRKMTSVSMHGEKLNGKGASIDNMYNELLQPEAGESEAPSTLLEGKGEGLSCENLETLWSILCDPVPNVDSRGKVPYRESLWWWGDNISHIAYIIHSGQNLPHETVETIIESETHALGGYRTFVTTLEKYILKGELTAEEEKSCLDHLKEAWERSPSRLIYDPPTSFSLPMLINYFPHLTLAGATDVKEKYFRAVEKRIEVGESFRGVFPHTALTDVMFPECDKKVAQSLMKKFTNVSVEKLRKDESINISDHFASRTPIPSTMAVEVFQTETATSCKIAAVLAFTTPEQFREVFLKDEKYIKAQKRSYLHKQGEEIFFTAFKHNKQLFDEENEQLGIKTWI